MELYGIKVIYNHTVHSEPQLNFFELQILMIKANSDDEAFAKAEEYAITYCFEYINVSGDKVSTEVYSLEDCYLIYEEDNDVREVYSCITGNKDAGKVWSNSCTSEEMKELRNIEFN